MSTPPTPQSILITGGSRGIGAALATHYATQGVTLFLGGRDQKALKEVEEACVAKGARVFTKDLDVLDQTGMRAWIQQADDQAPLDLVIANAGVSAGTGTEGFESQEQAQQIFAVNVYGVNNTLYPALLRMLERNGDGKTNGRGHKGQIALMSSMAAFYGFPGAPAYCASKAAVRVAGEALRALYKDRGTKINVICPGYINTDMGSVNQSYRPMRMSAERAARIIARGLAKDKARIAFPWPVYALVWLISNLPAAFTDWLLSKLARKPNFEEQEAIREDKASQEKHPGD